ncbi:MAG: HIT domain-containing protein [Proteobacteria bacterium]|nr:HIT domain-containing protein [Pseudomonadota bacterium]
MKSLYAPWRMEYIKSDKPDGCIFCKDSIRNDEFVLYEGEYSFVIINRYPYINGHLMIAPFRHVGNLEDLTSDEKREIFDLLSTSVKALKETMNSEGFNIGINLGRAAGAGVDDHVHVHVVPRWSGDTNFMTVLGEVRVIPEDVLKTRDVLLPYFQKL